MTNKWYKRFFPDFKSIEQHSSLSGLKKYLGHSYLWHLDKESVARGVAIGLFAGIVPLIPFQTVMAVFLSIFFRGNLAIAFLTSWVSNPFTIVPITYFIYFVGDSILDATASHPHLSIKATHFTELSLHQWLYQFGKGFFVGLPIVSIGAALIGYVTVLLVWHITELFQKKISNKEKSNRK